MINGTAFMGYKKVRSLAKLIFSLSLKVSLQVIYLFYFIFFFTNVSVEKEFQMVGAARKKPHVKIWFVDIFCLITE